MGAGRERRVGAAFNFFFLPPAHTLLINDSSDWRALGAFVITAVVTAKLAARARQGREEAARRAAEARLGEGFATLIATPRRRRRAARAGEAGRPWRWVPQAARSSRDAEGDGGIGVTLD